MSTTCVASTSRFGEVAFEPEDVVRFEDGLLGFAGLHRYLLLSHRDDSPFRWLQSVDDPGLAFLVVDPALYAPDYGPSMPEVDAARIGLAESTPRLVYTIVTIPQGKPEEMTINLAGPIVVNAETGAARQVVLEDERYPIRFRALARSTTAQAA